MIQPVIWWLLSNGEHDSQTKSIGPKYCLCSKQIDREKILDRWLKITQCKAALAALAKHQGLSLTKQPMSNCRLSCPNGWSTNSQQIQDRYCICWSSHWLLIHTPPKVYFSWPKYSLCSKRIDREKILDTWQKIPQCKAALAALAKHQERSLTKQPKSKWFSQWSDGY